MKKILIVDDEFLVRIGLRSMVNWEENGYEIVGEAENGQKALEMIETLHPDIVLLDLKMEPVDGMEVMRQSRNKYTNLQFVVLSSYNDFDNVKQAMKLGAQDYIFKLTVTGPELLGVLNQLPDVGEKDTEISNENKEALKSSLIDKMIHGNPWEKEIRDELTKLDPRIQWDQRYEILLLAVDNFFLVKEENRFGDTQLFQFAIHNIAEELVKDQLGGIVFDYHEGQLLILIPTELDNYRTIEIKQTFSRLYESVKRYLGCEISVVVGEKPNSLDQLKNIYPVLLEELQFRFFKMPDEFYLVCQSRSVPQNKVPSMDKCQEYIVNRDLPRLKDMMSQLFEEIQNHFSVKEARSILVQLYAVLCLTKKNGFVAEDFVDHNGVDLYHAITKYDRLYDIRQAMELFLGKYQMYLAQEGLSVKKEILEIKQYVSENLDQNLSVRVLALKFNMNESYFSHFFKKEVGMNFTDYVTSKRIEKAIQLLANTQMKVNEIAYEVGFDNTNYFSVVFKKITGKSPQEFRRNI